MAEHSDSGEPPGSDLYIEYLDNPDTPRGVVVVVHGYAEHSGRYHALAERILGAGFSVVLYDHRGFGKSPGRPAYVDRISGLVDDLARVVSITQRRCPGLPLILFGHSMGGLVSVLYCLGAQAETSVSPKSPPIHGLILSSALLRTQEAAFLQRIATVIGAIAPRLPTVSMDRSAISRDPAVVAEAEADPLNYHGRIPARTGAEFVRGMKRVWKDAHKFDLPLLIIHGTADRLTDPSGSRDLYTSVSSNHKQLSLFEGAYHETFHDADRERVMEGIIDWLEESVSP
ncbi:MAG: alpha/beta hydrolase [Rhodothermales bacterium]|nr:alpha/beta hydrolase [Rhodothermales bacterium]